MDDDGKKKSIKENVHNHKYKQTTHAAKKKDFPILFDVVFKSVKSHFLEKKKERGEVRDGEARRRENGENFFLSPDILSFIYIYIYILMNFLREIINVLIFFKKNNRKNFSINRLIDITINRSFEKIFFSPAQNNE